MTWPASLETAGVDDACAVLAPKSSLLTANRSTLMSSRSLVLRHAISSSEANNGLNCFGGTGGIVERQLFVGILLWLFVVNRSVVRSFERDRERERERPEQVAF